MRLCIATTSFPRWPEDYRGSFVFEAARALHQRGIHVRVVTAHSPGARQRETWDGIEIIRHRYLPEAWETLQELGGGLPSSWKQRRLTRLAMLPYVLAHTLAIARYSRACDLIHANWTLSGFATWASSLWHRRPFVITVQGSDMFQAAQMPLVRPLTRLSLQGATRVLALSQPLADAVLRLSVAADRVEVLPNGVDTDRFRPGVGPREPVILFVGSLIERKGVRYLIEAFASVCRGHPDLKLVVVGEGPQHDQLVQLAARLGVANKCLLAGSQSPSQVQRWMQRAQLLVLPSLEEGLGVVLLEAMACGTPCVASRVGGIPDAVGQEAGLLVPPGDPTALAEAIARALEDRTRWESMSRAARSRVVTRFSWSAIAGRLIEIYIRAGAGS